jgi:hypothetical protein
MVWACIAITENNSKATKSILFNFIISSFVIKNKAPFSGAVFYHPGFCPSFGFFNNADSGIG